MLTVNRIKEKLDCKVNWSNYGVTALESDNLYIQVICPHEGTDYKYVIRADFKETYCKWSNAFYEAEISNLDEEFELVLKDLDKMNKEKNLMIHKIDDSDGSYWDYTDYANSNWTS